MSSEYETTKVTTHTQSFYTIGGFDLGAGYTKASTKGETYAAALCGIPSTLKNEYNYGFNWKLAQYYINDNSVSYSFPFVTYALDSCRQPHFARKFLRQFG